MWMHNGGIGAWNKVKRKLASGLEDRWFNFVQGGTDSEWAFALFLDTLSHLVDHDPAASPPEGGFDQVAMRTAMLMTISRINEIIAGIVKEGAEEDTRSLLNLAVSDGYTVVCTRYVNSRKDEAASLFWSSGTGWREVGEGKDGKKDFKMERKDKGADIVLVASEPLTFDRGELQQSLTQSLTSTNTSQTAGSQYQQTLYSQYTSKRS
jgi:glutamine amidotransferase